MSNNSCGEKVSCLILSRLPHDVRQRLVTVRGIYSRWPIALSRHICLLELISHVMNQKYLASASLPNTIQCERKPVNMILTFGCPVRPQQPSHDLSSRNRHYVVDDHVFAFNIAYKGMLDPAIQRSNRRRDELTALKVKKLRQQRELAGEFNQILTRQVNTWGW